ncbi:hypothetical protein A2U01_0110862, partial [Trifolium medium]|nr:hypothetical protein [Trifolium medium]
MGADHHCPEKKIILLELSLIINRGLISASQIRLVCSSGLLPLLLQDAI